MDRCMSMTVNASSCELGLRLIGMMMVTLYLHRRLDGTTPPRGLEETMLYLLWTLVAHQVHVGCIADHLWSRRLMNDRSALRLLAIAIVIWMVKVPWRRLLELMGTVLSLRRCLNVKVMADMMGRMWVVMAWPNGLRVIARVQVNCLRGEIDKLSNFLRSRIVNLLLWGIGWYPSLEYRVWLLGKKGTLCLGCMTMPSKLLVIHSHKCATLAKESRLTRRDMRTTT